MVDPAYVARVRAYLEAHRATYDQAALRQKLLDDGHPPAVIDLAMAQVYGYEPPSGAPVVTSGGGTSLALVIVGTFIITYVLVGILLTIAFSQSNDWGLLLPLAVLPIEIGAALLARRRNRQLARGLAWGIAAAWVPIALLALLFGICLALLGAF